MGNTASFNIIDLSKDKNAKTVFHNNAKFGTAIYYICTKSDTCVYNSKANAAKNDRETGRIFKMFAWTAASILEVLIGGDDVYLRIKCGSNSGYVKLGRRNVRTYGTYDISTAAYGGALGYVSQAAIGNAAVQAIAVSQSNKMCTLINKGGSVDESSLVFGSLNEENLKKAESDSVSDDIVTASDVSISSSDSTVTGEDEIDPTYEFQITNAGTFYYNIGDFLPNYRITTNEDGDVIEEGIPGANTLLDDYLNGKYGVSTNGFDYGHNYRTLFGAPYQFLPTTDCRLNKNGFVNVGEDSLKQAGYEFANKIVSKMPILYVTPGNTSFMGSSSKTARQKLLSNLHRALDIDTGSSLSAMLDDYTGKLYTISPAYAEYFNYVNPMCRAGAIFLGIHNRTLHGVTLENYHWGINQGQTYQLSNSEEEILGQGDTEMQEEMDATETTTEQNEGEETPTEPEVEEYTYEQEEAAYQEWESNKSKVQTNVKGFLSSLYYSNTIAFYINSDYSFQESFTNETTDSLLATTINSLSDRAREVQFLLGTASQAVGEAFDKVDGTLSEIKSQINSIVDKVAGGNSIFTTIANSVKTIVSGGRMQFPQIWANSTFAKSYNITIKLITPNPDPYSWWLDCFVPMCHLMGLVMPRSEYVNSYTTPFLIKAFYKGMFNIDMGIITEMQFNRGKEGSWTKDGLPTVIEVSFTIQDLYSSMGMTSIGKMFKGLTLQNVAEMDYIANLCGVNINDPDVFRMVKFWAAFNFTTRINDFLPNLKLNISTSIKTSVTNALNGLWM